MSTLKVDAIRHNSATSDAITTSSDGTCTAKLTSVAGSQLSHRNKARNGAMKISQRGTTFSPTTSSTQLIDGWRTDHGSSGNLDTTVTQSTDAPAGFTKSLKITPDSTLTPSGSQNGLLAHYLEGQDFQDLAFGTSDAKPITVSWYAKTSATGAGNYTVKVEYKDSSNNTYAVNKLFAFTTTWTRYTYTIPATGTATTNGIVDSNGLGFRVEYHLFAGPDDVASQFTQWTINPTPTFKVISGQKNFMDNTNNELYITGLQIEVGDTATSFEHRSFGEELVRCQRYYQKYSAGGDCHMLAARGEGSSSCVVGVPLCVPLRAQPTVACGSHRWYRSSSVAYTTSTTTPSVLTNDPDIFSPVISIAAGGHTTSNNEAGVWTPHDDNNLTFSAEL